MSETVISHLRKRGFVDQLTSEELDEATKKPIKLYAGFDPTADSLHIGNLMGIMLLAHFQRFGHTPVVLLGGMTGLIGDPSGKSHERPLLDQKAVEANVESIRGHFEQVLDFTGKYPSPIIVNNNDWYSDFTIVDFLRDVGKHFRIGTMMAKDIVKNRLESEEGMSYTEFSYQLIQGYDFHHLNESRGVILQAGGSDQWGNITAGTDLIRKLSRNAVYGMTWPLLTRSDGKKFGKTEGGAVWLSPDRCSPYQFYQYFIQVPDDDVIKMMKLLTFMELEEIAEYEKMMGAIDYIPNTAQKKLAGEVTRIIHGDEGIATALRVTEGAGPGKSAELTAEVLEEIGTDMPHTTLSKDLVIGHKYADLAVATSLSASKGEANRLVKNGGAYINNEKITDQAHEVASGDIIAGKFLLIGAGKKKKALIKIQ